jgi:hypothetical protein
MFHPSDSAEAAGVSLAWDAAKSVSGYKIYRGTTSGSYTSSVNVGNVTSYTVSNLTAGTPYYFAVTAYDSSNIESDYSNEVAYNSSGTCSYAISPSSASYSSSGGTGTIAVTTTSGCSWTASTGVSWATISSGSSGSASGTVSYSVAANTGSSRTAAFTVAGKTFSISQSGATTSGGTYYTLTISNSGTGSGTVSVNPSGTSFPAGTYVTLTATPAADSTFDGWTGICAGRTTCSGTMNANYTVGAIFTAKTTSTSSYFTITSSAATGGSISPSGTVSVSSGSSKSYTITARSGYRIYYVLVDGQNVGAVSSYTFSNVKANHTIKAYFRYVG